MAPRFVCFATALALVLAVGIDADQTTHLPQLPKTVSLSVVEKDAMPHKLQYKSEIQIWEVQSKAVKVTSGVDGKASIVMTDGTMTVSTPDKSKSKTDVFSRLDLAFAANGAIIEFKVTR